MGGHVWSPRGIARFKGGGGTFEAETEALVARFTTPPTPERKVSINTLIVALKAAGIWAKLDALYVMAAADAQAAQRNWVADLNNLTPFNAPTFTADRGYAGDGATSYLETNAVRNALVQNTQNSAHLASWETLNVADGNSVVGISASDGFRIAARSGTNTMVGRINDGATLIVTGQTDARGLAMLDRSGAAARTAYKNGVAVGSDTQASVAPGAQTIWILRYLGAYASASKRVGMMSTGASLTADQHLAYYTALLAYMQAVGAA